jgi:predicted DNA-binding transcriptional regulator YafY
MAEKIDIYRSYGEKLISLFARLLFSGERYSLTELSRMLNCSKQSVLRLMEDIRKAYGVDIEESYSANRKYYRVKRPGSTKALYPLTELELSVLQMCRDFTSHMLGKKLFEEATRAIAKSQALLPGEPAGDGHHFGVFRPGTIDYTPYHEIICNLIEAMEARKVCRINYRAIATQRPKSFHIKPLKIFSHRDTLYLHAQRAKEPGKPYRAPDYDPLLAIHRMKQVEITDRTFDYPADFDFEKSFNRHFGIMKGKAFQVEVEFTGWAAQYVSERIWSLDQKISIIGKNKIQLTFSATSEEEVKSWILSYGAEVKILKPPYLIKTMRKALEHMIFQYSSCKCFDLKQANRKH